MDCRAFLNIALKASVATAVPTTRGPALAVAML